jgi:hypothetical protein
LPAAERFSAKNWLPKNSLTLSEDSRHSSKVKLPIFLSIKIEEKQLSEPSTELRYLICGPRYLNLKSSIFWRRRAKL